VWDVHVLDHPLLSQRYFFPRPDAPTRPTWVNAGRERLACARLGSRGERMLLHFHGNGEVVADWEKSLAWLPARGVDVFLAEYRGYGSSTGEPGLVAMLDDVESIAKATGMSPERIVVYGRSLGSLYAIHLASRMPGLAGLVIESGIASVLERLALRVRPDELGLSGPEFAAEVERHFDHRRKLAAYGGPTLVLHARHDHLVGMHHAEQNAAWSGGRLVIYDEGDHNLIWAFNERAMAEEIGSFCEAAFLEPA
jgi:pimeloyl-ACP methyl ester carboxylesterase